MCAIAHFLEDEGIATSSIVLIRLHAEKARPPRALWVPFQLGRPAGAPLKSVFQLQVLRAALGLLERNDGPVVLEDFPDDEPDSADVAGWIPPVTLNVATVAEEVALLEPWHQRSLQETGRTTVGVSRVDMPSVVRYLSAMDSNEPAPKPRRDLAEVQMIRYAADDLKAYYLEALTAAGEPPSGWQLANWFWEETQAGALIRALRNNSFDHPDPQRRHAAWWLVPDGFSEREEVERTWEVAYTL